MAKLIDLTNTRFGLWTVKAKGPTTYQPQWICVCDCGTERLVSGANLRTGVSSSCGCDRQHVVAHGQARRGNQTATYKAWKAMHSRCKPLAGCYGEPNRIKALDTI